LPLFLGIDTGGTYTDAVLFEEGAGIVAKAKALTTRHDLAIGIGQSVTSVLEASGARACDIGLVSLSTTLATNALVEGQGSRVGLVMIGFEEKDMNRDGLAAALGRDPVIHLPGGHDVHGRETPLDTGPLESVCDDLQNDVTAFAVAGYFAVRNPDHEIRVRDLLRQRTNRPVTCSHELTSRLGGPRRALTTLLNARLIAMIDRLIEATQTHLQGCGIAAPIMVVRGDGALIAADVARAQPIETILSGPAASLVGARHLTGLADGVVADIGGTTTDVAILEGGRPRLDPEGAIVGGYRTMVEAVAMHTFGIGGDSEVHVDRSGLQTALRLGPRRLIPLSLAAHLDGDGILPHLERQRKADRPGRFDGLFACLTGVPASYASGLMPPERALFERLAPRLQPLDRLLDAVPQKAVLDRLVERGLAHISGFTPSDAMHVLDRQATWNRKAASAGAELMARLRNGAGQPVAASASDFSAMTVARLERQSAEAVLKTCLAEDGADDIDPTRSPTVARALSQPAGIVRFAVSLDRPVIGLGASAGLYYPAIARLIGADAVIPNDADVANAVGAVAGHVSASVTIFVTQPEEGVYMVNGAGHSHRMRDEAAALAKARAIAEAAAFETASLSGAEQPSVSTTEAVDAPEIEGSRKLIEARIIATASGRPRIART
jgi:N-methylhydantoinase A/oxoprolinase/acetone carboxylase beta subunit